MFILTYVFGIIHTTIS